MNYLCARKTFMDRQNHCLQNEKRFFRTKFKKKYKLNASAGLKEIVFFLLIDIPFEKWDKKTNSSKKIGASWAKFLHL